MKTAKLEKLEAANIVEAASKGASDSIPLVAYIAAMLIAFTSIIYWLNSALAWMGECVGFGEFSNCDKGGGRCLIAENQGFQWPIAEICTTYSIKYDFCLIYLKKLATQIKLEYVG